MAVGNHRRTIKAAGNSTRSQGRQLVSQQQLRNTAGVITRAGINADTLKSRLTLRRVAGITPPGYQPPNYPSPNY